MELVKLLAAVTLVGAGVFTPFDVEDGRGQNLKSESQNLLAQSTDPFVPPVDEGQPGTSDDAGTRMIIDKCDIDPIVCEDESNLG